MPQSGREVVIVEAARTPVGRGHPEKGYYKDVHPNELLGRTFTEVIERAGIEPSAVEDVIGGCVQQYGEQMFNVTRNAWLQAGLPMETPATTVDRQCGSAQQAVNFAAALIAAGVHDVVIGGGVEHMGHIPMGVGFKWTDDGRLAVAAGAAGALRARPAGALGRDDRRQVGAAPPRARRARAALAPARRTGRPRRAASSARRSRSRSTATRTSPTRASAPTRRWRRWPALKPAFKPDGKVTAGNSSQISDGAAAVLLMSADKRRASWASRRARRSSTRRRSASTP